MLNLLCHCVMFMCVFCNLSKVTWPFEHVLKSKAWICRFVCKVNFASPAQ